MRLINYLNESKQDETTWEDQSWDKVFDNKNFHKWLNRKTTTFFYNKWDLDTQTSNLKIFKTTDNENNILKLTVEKYTYQHKSKSGTRDPEKTKREITVKLGIDKGMDSIIVKKTTKGEDLEKMKKWNSQVEKIKELLQNTFGVNNIHL